jgi:hypothetical protein
VYMDECNSWYRSEGGKGDRIVGLWPGSALHCLETLRAPRWEDFEYESKEENGLKWLGNGWSSVEMGNAGDRAWYLEPDMMSVPKQGHPEDDEKFKKRAFSH